MGYIDNSRPYWRDDLQEQILDDEDVMLSAPSEKRDTANDTEGHDEFNPELIQPVIKIIITTITWALE